MLPAQFIAGPPRQFYGFGACTKNADWAPVTAVSVWTLSSGHDVAIGIFLSATGVNLTAPSQDQTCRCSLIGGGAWKGH